MLTPMFLPVIRCSGAPSARSRFCHTHAHPHTRTQTNTHTRTQPTCVRVPANIELQGQRNLPGHHHRKALVRSKQSCGTTYSRTSIYNQQTERSIFIWLSSVYLSSIYNQQTERSIFICLSSVYLSTRLPGVLVYVYSFSPFTCSASRSSSEIPPGHQQHPSDSC